MKSNTILLALFFSVIYTIQAQTTDTESLNDLISKKRAYNQVSKQGYCIQLYNGNEASALKRMKKFQEEFPDIEIKRIYKVPEWKIQTTMFKTKLEADKVLNLIKEEYPGARVL